MFGGGIGLDPAAANDRSGLVPSNALSRRLYRLKDGVDGLVQLWRGFGLVFCNPPYGTAVRKWAKKCVAEFGFPPVSVQPVHDECLMLVAARVDTRWFKLLWRHSSAVLLFSRRLQFIGEENGAKFPNALIYFGRRVDRFTRHFGHLGLVIATRPVRSSRALVARPATLHFPKP